MQIDSVDVGYIALGHPENVKLDTYPLQKHGVLEAKVRTISGDAFRRDPSARSGADVYYLCRITLTSTQLKNMLDSARLMPGMTLSAEIVVRQRSVLSYLAWPLAKGMSEAIREP